MVLGDEQRMIDGRGAQTFLFLLRGALARFGVGSRFRFGKIAMPVLRSLHNLLTTCQG